MVQQDKAIRSFPKVDRFIGDEKCEMHNFSSECTSSILYIGYLYEGVM